MRNKDRKLAKQIEVALSSFEKSDAPLPGIEQNENREVFIQQIIESVRRVKYVSVLAQRQISDLRVDPTSDLFDPLRAAIVCQRRELVDDAYWFVFQFVHFGKSKKNGWRLARDVYGGLSYVTWDWKSVNSDPKGFRRWLAKHENTLRGDDGISRSFGNHRKYESLSGMADTGTGAAVESYVKWVEPFKSHENLMKEALKKCDGDPKRTFNYLFHSMDQVMRFGRTAKFDYLCMIGKLGLAPIEPDATYMAGATGPLSGARLLFETSAMAAFSSSDLEELSGKLAAKLGIGMQAMEDALCNWQKSPAKFARFRG